jgi:HrpA-like RNA helicase/ribosomal protein S1
MQNHQITVIVAPTGAGKSTFLPFRLIVPPDPMPSDLWTRSGQIVITQPRIQATRNIPAFVARDLHGSTLGAGFDIGFRHSGSPATDWRNKMVYMTDGTLINMIVRNELGRLSIIMIDEAHERSLNIDLILGLLKVQLPRYPQLKLIIASATIDTNLFINYYGGPEKVGFYEFPGKRQHPVESKFRESDPIPENQFSGRMPDEVAKKVFDILLAMETNNDPDLITMQVNNKSIIAKGDILAFLQGEKPIERAIALIREMVDDEPALAGKVDILPLYTKLPQKQQDLALQPKKDKKRWRVVISTNVAETSLTVEGIVHVVETGLINESQWDPQTQTSFVMPKIHSQAGCKQRWGRAGRVQPGIAHCLYTEEQFNNFPPHTFPEIVRAPLDQIVLTAKAAGVDDIKAFDWIQRPPEAELDRAPQYLSQIGAIDADGDLTEHGLELRQFAAETDVANLMILADRFGCAVEMATLIPMLKLGGYTKLLLWDRSWDAPTKRTIHRIHQGLIEPCLDDVEFYLKLWEAWEGTRFGRNDNKQRQRWSQQFFVNNTVFRRQIVPDRETLLGSLSGHKKDDQARPIDFNLLTRVRIVLAYGLASQIYQLANPPQAGQEMREAPIYKPYILDPEANPELVKLHEDAVVEISPESICFERQFPDFFVCGKRQRVRRRLSPQAEPVTIITAAFIALIKPDWLKLIGQPPITVARYIAAETRDDMGALIPTITESRLFSDQNYPIGATFSCCSVDGGQTVEIGKKERNPRLLRTSKSYEEIEAPDEIEVLEVEGQLKEKAGVSEAGRKVSLVPDEEDDVAIWVDMLDEDEDIASTLSPSRKQNTQEQFFGQIVYAAQTVSTDMPFSSIVVGYNFDNREIPIINLEQPIAPSPFSQFRELYKPGVDINVELVAIEQYVNDWLLYLVVREIKTGLEIVLDPYDASLIGRNFAIDYLRQFDMGMHLTVTVEEIDSKAKRVRVNRLKNAEAALLRFMGKDKERTIEATIVEARDNGLYLWLDPGQTQDHMPIGAFAHISRLPQRPDEMSLGQTCRVIVKPQQWRRPLRRSITSLSDEAQKELAQYRWGNNIEWDDLNHTLTVKGRINYDQRCKLLDLSEDGGFHRTINILFRRSNELDTKVVDVTGLQNLQFHQIENKPTAAKIVSVGDRGVEVEVEGFRTWVPKHEVTFDPTEDLEQKFKPGDIYNVHVKEVNEEQGQATVSLLRSEDDPLNDYHPGQILQGHVVSTTEFGAFVELTPGVQGLVHVSELAWWRVERPTDIVHRGQSVKVQILEINREERLLELTMRLPDNDPLRKFQINHRVPGKVSGFTNDGIAAFVELTPGVEGFLYKDEISLDRVNNARDVLQEGQTVTVRITELDPDKRKLRLTIRGLYEHDELYVPSSHRRLIIGSGGTVIKDIQRKTNTYINLDDNGSCVIQGLSQHAVDAALQKIKSILANRIVTFPIKDRQVGMLKGKGGNTIQTIIKNTNSQINIDGLQVTVVAQDDTILRKTLAEIQSAIIYCEAIVQVPSFRARYVIGTGGQNVKSIRNLPGINWIDVEKDNANNFTGRITIKGKTRTAIEQATYQISHFAGTTATYVSLEEGVLPSYTEVRPDTPPVVTKQQMPQTTQPILSRQPASPPPLPRSQPAKPPTPPVIQPKPQVYQEIVQVTSTQIALLTRKQGGFFTTLFGGGKSALDKIQESTSTRISLDTSTGNIRIVGRSQQAVQNAITALRQAIR